MNADILSTAGTEISAGYLGPEADDRSITHVHTNSARAQSSSFSIASNPDPIRRTGGGLKDSRRGAGSILDSPLSTTGWRFPHFALTDQDERYLFDVEVKELSIVIYFLFILIDDV